MKRNASFPDCRPFLKWAGGKGQLLDELTRRVGKAKPFARYHEPFVGGGALFFALASSGEIAAGAFLSDKNSSLIDAYRGVRNQVDSVIDLLRKHKEEHSKEHYYDVRARVPALLAERAARIIYLNRTCFNGLFRENSKGEFNVPMGRYVNPRICDETNLRECWKALQQAHVEARHFEEVLESAVKGDFVYFDPPYVPLSPTSNFTGYDKGRFDEQSQQRLAEVFAELDGRGVKVLLSNSSTPLVRDLYQRFKIETVYATRLVNSRADRRGKVPEVLVRNY